MVDAALLNHARLRKAVDHLREYSLFCCVVVHLVFVLWTISVYGVDSVMWLDGREAHGVAGLVCA